ncbi:hypothetical protein EDC01DRAFT_634184 [Geopyxis carbonaria]|nr:hypothetical protein EDC01DRAFT_634184 [Geopyxis carbonaria]
MAKPINSPQRKHLAGKTPRVSHSPSRPKTPSRLDKRQTSIATEPRAWSHHVENVSPIRVATPVVKPISNLAKSCPPMTYISRNGSPQGKQSELLFRKQRMRGEAAAVDNTSLQFFSRPNNENFRMDSKIDSASVLRTLRESSDDEHSTPSPQVTPHVINPDQVFDSDSRELKARRDMSRTAANPTIRIVEASPRPTPTRQAPSTASRIMMSAIREKPLFTPGIRKRSPIIKRTLERNFLQKFSEQPTRTQNKTTEESPSRLPTSRNGTPPACRLENLTQGVQVDTDNHESHETNWSELALDPQENNQSRPRRFKTHPNVHFDVTSPTKRSPMHRPTHPTPSRLMGQHRDEVQPTVMDIKRPSGSTTAYTPSIETREKASGRSHAPRRSSPPSSPTRQISLASCMSPNRRVERKEIQTSPRRSVGQIIRPEPYSCNRDAWEHSRANKPESPLRSSQVSSRQETYGRIIEDDGKLHPERPRSRRSPRLVLRPQRYHPYSRPGSRFPNVTSNHSHSERNLHQQIQTGDRFLPSYMRTTASARIRAEETLNIRRALKKKQDHPLITNMSKMNLTE